MPLSKRIARSNRRFVNPIALRFAGKIAPFAIVEHRGRISGVVYRTPTAVFRAGEQFLLAPTYGEKTDWLQNIRAEDGCFIMYRGKRLRLVNPDVFRGDPNDQPFPWIVRRILRTVHVRDFVRLSLAANGSDTSLSR